MFCYIAVVVLAAALVGTVGLLLYIGKGIGGYRM